MGQYKISTTNSQNFSLIFENEIVGELVYEKWYSFNAEILLNDGTNYQLEPKGIWDSKIELKHGTQTLLEFKMGWTGIIIKTLFENKEDTYLLKPKGLFSNKYVLLDIDKAVVLVAETDYKWHKLNFDYTIETPQTFDNFQHKELVLLTILHCLNYYITITVAASV